MRKLFLSVILLLSSVSSFASGQKREKLQKLCKFFIKESRFCEQASDDSILKELDKRGVLEQTNVMRSATCVWPPS